MGAEDDTMPKAARKRTILEFLADTGIAAPPSVIYYNLEDPTFGKETAKRLLKELAEEDLARKVPDKRGYYEITDAGREYVSSTDT